MAPEPSARWGSIIRVFTARFGGTPTLLAQAPGRVNLIGEHTDYNDGLVLPAAIGRYVRIAARPNGSDAIRLYAAAFDQAAEIPAQDPSSPPLPRWARYAQGVARELAGRGIALTGLDAVIDADLPIGSGLSSSAALEVAVSLVLEHTAGVTLPARERAHLCHTAEVEFVGVPCGIMDQFASALCRSGHALFLDCKTLDTHHVPLPSGLIVAVCDTGVRRTLADSAYAVRRQECAAAVQALQAAGQTIHTLRDLTPDDLPLVERLPDPLRLRARHVVTENARVVRTAGVLESGEIDDLGEVFAASHRSLRDDYQVSSPELDAMVEAALDAPGCLAARMTGAGFGGAVVALVRRPEADRFLATVASGYRRRTGREGTFFDAETADGAAVVPLHES